MGEIARAILPTLLEHALDRKRRQRQNELMRQQLENAKVQQRLLEAELGMKPIEAERARASTARDVAGTRQLEAETDYFQETGRKQAAAPKEPSAAELEQGRRDDAARAYLTNSPLIGADDKQWLKALQVAAPDDELFKEVAARVPPASLKNLKRVADAQLEDALHPAQPDLMGRYPGGAKPTSFTEPERSAMLREHERAQGLIARAMDLRGEGAAQAALTAEQMRRAPEGQVQLPEDLKMANPTGMPEAGVDWMRTVMEKAQTPEGRAELRGSPFQEPGMLESLTGQVVPSEQQAQTAGQAYEGPTAAMYGNRVQRSGKSPEDLITQQLLYRSFAKQLARSNPTVTDPTGYKIMPSLQPFRALARTPEDLQRLAVGFQRLVPQDQRVVTSILLNSDLMNPQERSTALERLRAFMGLDNPLATEGLPQVLNQAAPAAGGR